MNKRNRESVLVIAAHPDDELLGLGGTLCRHRDEGDVITILLLSNGEDSRGKEISDPKKRLIQATLVAEKLNAELNTKNFPDNAFDSVPLLEITKSIEGIISGVRPSVIYTHHSEDLNIDHRLTFQAAITAARPISGRSVKKIFTFETPSSTEWQDYNRKVFIPSYFSDISKYLSEKNKLLSIYKDEIRSFPHPRSLEGIEVLAKYRGMEVGLLAAEAFQVVRIIK